MLLSPGFLNMLVNRSRLDAPAQVHTNLTVRSNGTLVNGPIVSTGQIFIDEALEPQIMAMEPYASHTEIQRVQNDADGVFTTESSSTHSFFI